MTVFGWIFMALSWVLILGLAFICLSRIFKKKKID